jgi:hypothetical protein
MLTWARAHDAEASGAGNDEVRVPAWQIRADSSNMCVIDRDIEDASVFLAFSGESAQAMSGLYLRGGWDVDCFARYFSQLWTSVDCGKSRIRCPSSSPAGARSSDGVSGVFLELALGG